MNAPQKEEAPGLLRDRTEGRTNNNGTPKSPLSIFRWFSFVCYPQRSLDKHCGRLGLLLYPPYKPAWQFVAYRDFDQVLWFCVHL